VQSQVAHNKLRARNNDERENDEKRSGQRCPECDGRLRRTESETTCEDCGLVVTDQHIDHGPEWRSFSDNSEKRTGAPRTVALHDKGLSTTLYPNTDGYGNSLPAKKQARMRRLKIRNSRSRFPSKIDRNRMYAFKEIRRITASLGLAKSVRDRACDLFRSAHDEDLLQGRTLEGFAAACVYAVCRCKGLPWEREEFKAAANCPPSRVDVAYDVLNQELGLPARPVTAKAFVPRYAAELDVTDRVRRDAESLAEQVDENPGLSGAPSSIAAGALYLAALGTCDESPQARVARVANCTATTVRKWKNELRDLQNV